ncbi:peptidylprolyl isomerase [Candidatus Dojkabacteria bacterium]|uniref:Peptidyl-prolyl cis-trans isomerase n=2 Tax=Candidatus Dojkabacteria TaxID=74243 RepID=A0A952DVH7_9BACT|nr:peptidylprolyl isomerase [Candidatus Dojkabacteria bacterium]
MKLFIVTIVLSLFITGCTMTDSTTSQNANLNEQTPTATEAENPAVTENTMVVLETTEGTIKLELFNSTMPITAGNFLKLVEDEFYNGVIFHRVIPNFMVQGGDPTGTGMGGPGYKIKDEFTTNNKNERGTISMANAGPNTGGSQFFINVVNNNFLDSKHPVFGKVVEGMEIVDKIVAVETDGADRPIEEVRIEKAYKVTTPE